MPVLSPPRTAVAVTSSGEVPAASAMFAALTDFLAARPAAITTLLAHHADDGRGRCRACTVGGKHGRLVWPCTIYAAAIAAQNISG